METVFVDVTKDLKIRLSWVVWINSVAVVLIRDRRQNTGKRGKLCEDRGQDWSDATKGHLSHKTLEEAGKDSSRAFTKIMACKYLDLRLLTSELWENKFL